MNQLTNENILLQKQNAFFNDTGKEQINELQKN